MNVLALAIPAAVVVYLIVPLFRPSRGEGEGGGAAARLRATREILVEIDGDQELGLLAGGEREEFLGREEEGAEDG